jgi:hypothetical protein
MDLDAQIVGAQILPVVHRNMSKIQGIEKVDVRRVVKK